MKARHDSVLMKEVLKALDVKPGDTIVDATIGGAGHFARLLDALGGGGVIVGIDADPSAVDRGREAYALDRRPERPVAHLVNDNFRNLARILERLGVGPANAILFDLGWSGYQIASPRGFSFSEKRDEPLLMTYSNEGEAAANIVNSASENDLSDIIYNYGEEKFSRTIAHAIVAMRAKERILTTNSLVMAILAGTPRWYHERKTHPATKTFQALRIAANDEIGALKEGLSSALNALSFGGHLAVISFHSIEDRVVKNMLRDAEHNELGSIMTKKPIIPSRSEIIANRRARSAKLRIFQRATVVIAENSDAMALNPSYA
jgi:16S rRNA (cytosine1402-N4)-methyltransferase